MEKAINFYELKQELAGLGFSDPQVIDDLRSAVFLDTEEQRIATNAFEVAFDLDLILDERGRLTFSGYAGSLGAGTDSWQLQTFQSNVHAGFAAELLQARATRASDTDDLSFMPLDPKAVQKEVRTIHMQNMNITKDTAEQFAGFVEESLTYGQQWLTYELEANGQVKADSWFAFSKRQAADEDAEITRPFAQLAKAEDLLPRLYQVIDQVPNELTQPTSEQIILGNPAQAIEAFKAAGLHHWDDDQAYPALAAPHGPFYHADEYEIGGHRLITELQLGGNNEQLTFKQLTVHLLPKGFGVDIDASLPFPLASLLPENTQSQSFDQLLPLQTIYEQLKNQEIIMNNENLSYLQKQLLNLGFGERLNEDLGKQIRQKPAEFTLPVSLEYNQQSLDYTLHFKAGEQNDMYFFNKYEAKSKDMEHTFYINRGNGVTAKEAYNLLAGRSVHKQLENLENEKYNAWLIIENGKLRTFNDKWNYHPEKAIDKMDIVGINEPGAKEKLMKSLEKGNRHQVTAMKNGKEVKLFIEANPAEHRVNLTNWKGEAQQLEHYKKPEFKQSVKQDNKLDKEQAQSREGTKKKRSQGRKQTV